MEFGINYLTSNENTCAAPFSLSAQVESGISVIFLNLPLTFTLTH